MEKNIFIYNQFENERVYLAISEDRVVEFNLSDVYDEYGQKTGPYYAGDNVILITETAVNLANRIAKEHDLDKEFEIRDYVSAYDDNEIYDELLEALENELEDEDWSMEVLTVKGFDYWDGSNWRSVVLETDSGEPDYEYADEELTEELNKAIEDMVFVKDVPGSKIYETEKWRIVISSWQGDFEKYAIIERNGDDDL